MENKSTQPLDYKKKPWWFNGINSTLGIAAGKSALNKDQLIKNARKSTGLHDLGKDFREEPLECLITSINEESALHPIGMFITKQRFQNLLATRLRAEYWFKKHPEILEQELYPLTLIAGLQRTGTTKLQRLLGSDPDNRTLLSWEALNPAPFLNHDSGEDPRIKFARTAEKSLKIMAPGFFSIHPVEHLAEEEDILLLDVSFMSTTAEATMNVPTYSAWLEQTDQSLAYVYAIKLLKLLQWQSPGKRWVLKSPHHLEFLSIIDKQFGKVQYLWTHRDVKYCLPSFLSMLLHSYSIFSNEVSVERIRDHWTRKIKYMLEKAIEFRISDKARDKFIDIHFETLIDDPFSELQKVYGKNGMDESLMKIFRKANKVNYRGKYGSHNYQLSDFKLTPEDINTDFGFYRTYLNSLKNNSKDKKIQ